jgi:hypothetical protein
VRDIPDKRNAWKSDVDVTASLFLIADEIITSPSRDVTPSSVLIKFRKKPLSRQERVDSFNPIFYFIV